MTEQYYDQDALNLLLDGAEELYKSVKTTMGRKGRNATIAQFNRPTITHDGVTVARSIHLDYKKSPGAELIKEVASKMEETAGDGTTTVTVLTYHILKEAQKLIAAGHNPIMLRNDLNKSLEEALTHLDFIKRELTKEDVINIATISAGDEAIGKMIADIDADLITVDAGQSIETTVDIINGYTIRRGAYSSYMTGEVFNPKILVTDHNFDLQKLTPVLASTEGPVAVFCNNIDTDTINRLVALKLQGKLDIYILKAPSYGPNRVDALKDLAAFTESRINTKLENHKLEDIKKEDFGTCDKLVINTDSVQVIGGKGDVSERLKVKVDVSEYEKDRRKASLAGKVAVIRVGGASETEIEEKKFRIDDAVAAVKSAKEEGIVPGGGITQIDIARKLQSDTPGSKILIEALYAPYRTILENAAISAEAHLNEVGDGKGIDIQKPDKVIDLIKAGIVDPAKVTRESLQNAVSVAGNAMTTGVLIVTPPEENEFHGAS